jgi:hypothetical protein
MPDQHLKHAQYKHLQQAIQLVSSPGNIQYTVRQLYYGFCRINQAWSGWPIRRTRPVSVPFIKFSGILESYINQHGIPGGLLLNSETPVFLSVRGEEPDLHDYGLSHVVICQTETIAAMLLANQFHLEFGSAVIGLHTATPLPDVLCAMLVRADKPRIYLLHDASVDGLSLAATLPAHSGIPENIPVITVGLRPAQAKRLRLFHQTDYAQGAISNMPWFIRLDELSWLKDGKKVELAALSPARLLNLLRVAVSQGEIPSIL